jgi:hypothetical protein
VLANITFESSHCFRKGNRNSGHKLCIMVCPSFWADYYILIYTQCRELMNLVGSHGSSSLPFVMKVMVCHFVSNSHEVMTALIVALPLIVVVEISLQLHQSLSGVFRFITHRIFLLFSSTLHCKSSMQPVFSHCILPGIILYSVLLALLLV